MQVRLVFFLNYAISPNDRVSLLEQHSCRAMLVRSVRRFATTAFRAAETLAQMEGPNPYGIRVAKAQGHVNGFVGGGFMWLLYKLLS